MDLLTPLVLLGLTMCSALAAVAPTRIRAAAYTAAMACIASQGWLITRGPHAPEWLSLVAGGSAALAFALTVGSVLEHRRDRLLATV